MPSLIKKGTSASSFRLSNGKLITLLPDVITVLTDIEFELLMNEYGSFITPRTITDSRPYGCFIVGRSVSYAEGANREIGKVIDNSAPIELKPNKKRKRGK